MRLLLILALCIPTLAFAKDVTVDTFVRAESDYNFQANMKAFAFGTGELRHLRDPIRGKRVVEVGEAHDR